MADDSDVSDVNPDELAKMMEVKAFTIVSNIWDKDKVSFLPSQGIDFSDEEKPKQPKTTAPAKKSALKV